MNQKTANNNESFDIDFSDLLAQDLSADTKKTDDTDVTLSADDLNFLESLSQPSDVKPPKVEVADTKLSDMETLDVEGLEAEKPKAETLNTNTPTGETSPAPTLNNKPSVEINGVSDELGVAVAKPKKAGLFASKKKDGGKKSPQNKKPSGKKDLNKPIFLILGVMGVILVLGLLWVFLGKSEEPAPMPEPAPVETQAPTPEPTPEVAPETPEAPAETAGATAENTDTPAPTGDFTPIDADAIVQAEIPDDPALIKEEIDRLADENSRLLDQAKDIDGILSDTEKLTSAKEEQIALLEAQIAQLEAQKGK